MTFFQGGGWKRPEKSIGRPDRSTSHSSQVDREKLVHISSKWRAARKVRYVLQSQAKVVISTKIGQQQLMAALAYDSMPCLRVVFLPNSSKFTRS